MKVLIAGATGLLAKPVIHRFSKEGFDLRLFSRSVDQSAFPGHNDIVKGDVFNESDLDKAMKGCEGVHITVSKVSEALVAEAIVSKAKKHGIKLISYVSGATVSEENRWFPMIDDKLKAEQTIIQSGIPYLIFRPTWFFESLEYMVRNGKASVIGKQRNAYHWIAADDFAKMIIAAYKEEKAKNSVFYCMGKELHHTKDLMEEYCRQLYPEIKKVNTVPIGMLKMMSFFTGKKELKFVASLFAYFEKVKEPVIDNSGTWKLLGEPELTFQKWLDMRK
ncbi:MAG: NAD(P)H-binding protein [Bacteroidales bacterium]|jgi:uncharacterized protein YbjT (DUF2867 family)